MVDKSEPSFHTVAIGASAGGLEALERFFENVTADSGMAYIVIQHLSPDFRSLMDQLLSRKTEMPVRMIEDGLTIEPGHVYVLPPGKEAVISKGTTFLKDRSTARELTFPIDEFFRSLARDAGSQAIGVILSGTGTDGSRGIQDVHAHGGLVLCQDESATFDGMPRSACATGVVDLVLSPGSMPNALVEYERDPAQIKTRLVCTGHGSDTTDHMDPSVRRILSQLNVRYALDFTHYKAPSIARRIERRLTLTGCNIEQYADRLESDPDLLDELYYDLLIGVTSFFRDRGVWELLEQEVIPQLIAKLSPEEEFRAWVAGTATGEEAYSLAILVTEAFEAAGRPCAARIFATDVHQKALARASQGIYPPESLAGLLEHRRERFFEERPEGFRVSPELRKLVVFTPHNIFQDAPFTRLHLATCRNVLIYLNQVTQQKALGLLSFGLRQDGVLCLGGSEALGDIATEFEPIEFGSLIFRKRRESGPPPGSGRAAVRLPKDRALSTNRGDRLVNQTLDIYDRVLSDFMPPGLLVTQSRQLVHTFGGASQYLVARDGRPSIDAIELLRSELQPVVSAAIGRVNTTGKPVSYPGQRVETNDGTRVVRVIVRPYGGDGKVEQLLVLFESEDSSDAPIEVIAGPPTRNEEIEALDRELQITRENLEASIAELQNTNERHQLGNEELTAANEELQSTNEELHSVNEELYTVNAEHQRKIDELTELTDDMDNLLTTTNVHTLFLDRDLRLRRFTPRIAEFFNLIAQDVGRRIDAFSNNLVDDDLIHEVRSVLETERAFEREVRDHVGRWYLLRIFPYLSRGNVEGAVLTLVDISSMKEASDALRASEQRFHLAVRGSNEGIWDWQSIDEEYIWCSPKFYKLLGYDDGFLEMTFSLWRDLLHPDDRGSFASGIRDHLKDDTPFDVECRIECADGRYRWFHCCGAAERGKDGQATRMAGSLDDITQRRLAEQEVREAVTGRDQFLAMLSHELRNPLSAIQNAVQLLEGDDESRAAARDVVGRQVAQMGRLLDDLLDVSRITHGKLELVREPMDIVQLVDQVSTVVPSTFDRGTQLSVELPNEKLWVRGDPVRLEQVIVNLLVNAFKYTTGEDNISVVVSRESDVAEIVVRDTGLGIPAGMIDDIFDLFVQSDDSIHRSNGGMGVGLTLVKSVVELHDGTVTARSEGPGTGSQFVIRLPLCENAEDGVGVLAGPATPAVRRIAIVEDIDDARRMLRMLLTAQGFEVFAAADGPSGVELILENLPDLAFIDIGLPGLDGYEVARRLRDDPRTSGVRLVALTGYGQASDRVAVRDAGFDEHLVKPLSPNELNRILSMRDSPTRV